MAAARNLGNIHICVIKISTKILLCYPFVNVYHQELTLFSANIIFAFDMTLPSYNYLNTSEGAFLHCFTYKYYNQPKSC